MKRFSNVIRALVSILFFVVLFTAVPRGDLLERFRDVEPLYLVLSLLMVPLMIALSCLKWKVLLDHQGHRVPFGYLMRVYFIGYFFTNLFPSTVGGDVVRSYYAGRRIGSQTHAAVAVFIERFSGLLLLLLLGILAPLLKPGLYGHIATIIPACCAVVLLLAVWWVWTLEEPLRIPDRLARGFFRGWRRLNVFMRVPRMNRLVDRLEQVYGRVSGHVAHFHDKLVGAVRAIGADRGALVVVVMLTMVFYLLTLLNVYLAFRTFGVRLDFIEMSSVIPTIMLTFLLPVSLGNVGLAEGAYVFYYSLLGVPLASTLAMALFMRLKLLFSGAFGFLCYVTHREFKPKVRDLRAAE